MALRFDVSKIEDKDEVTNHPSDPTKWHPVTEMIVQLLMIVGMNSITDANYYRVWVRINSFERVSGSMLKAIPRDDDGNELDGELLDRYITIDDVRKHIGLTTNVSELSGPEWAVKLYGIIRDIIFSKIRREDFGGDYYAAQEFLYPLEQHEQHGTLECGCPANIVADEGHQEGCEHYEPYDEN